MVIGEASGDNLASGLIDALTRRGMDFEIVGICGPLMMQRSARALHSLDSISAIGVEGLFWKIAKILKVRRSLIRELLQYRPDVYIGVDAPDFNLGIELRLRRAGIPTVQYVSPTVWAWRGYRIRKIKRAAMRVLTIYPFESELFERHRVPYCYVGHPLADALRPGGQEAARRKFGYDAQDTVVAILPGSRMVEVKHLGPLFAQVAALAAWRDSNLKFISPAATAEIRAEFESAIGGQPDCPSVRIVDGDSIDVMKAADAVVLASGTAALEAALLGKPLVVAYKVSRLSYLLVKLLGTTKHYCVLNHLLRQPQVPEFMQADATADNIASELGRLLEDAEYRTRQVNAFAEISAGLECGANDLAAREIAQVLGHAH